MRGVLRFMNIINFKGAPPCTPPPPCLRAWVVVLDILMKNEMKHEDMLHIMKVRLGYLGDSYPRYHRVVSGDDYERQVGAKKHKMDENTKEERLTQWLRTVIVNFVSS